MSIIKKLFLGLLCFALVGCIMPPHKRFRVHNTPKQDWSKFVYPPAGTPSILAVYHFQNGAPIKVLVPGAWKDSKPWVVRFLIVQRMEKVCIIQIIHEGQPIVTKIFDPPVVFEQGTSKGIQEISKGSDL